MSLQKFQVEMTDLFAGEANYSWIRRAEISVPELTHYGYDGSTNYSAANKKQRREIMKRAKAALGITGLRGITSEIGDSIEFRPYGNSRIVFVNFVE